MIDPKVISYLRKKSGTDNKALQYQYVLSLADYFRKESQSAIQVGRTFSAEVPPELEEFVENDFELKNGAYAD